MRKYNMHMGHQKKIPPHTAAEELEKVGHEEVQMQYGVEFRNVKKQCCKLEPLQSFINKPVKFAMLVVYASPSAIHNFFLA
jgi:hypothetical protein